MSENDVKTQSVKQTSPKLELEALNVPILKTPESNPKTPKYHPFEMHLSEGIHLTINDPEVEKKNALENINRKRILICEQLQEIESSMKECYREAKKISRHDNCLKSTIVLTSAIGAIVLYVGFEQRVDGQAINAVLYYIATACASISSIFGQLMNMWNLSEKAYNSRTTAKGLSNLHDFVSYQLVRNHVTSQQMDALLADMSARLLLIRDFAGNESLV